MILDKPTLYKVNIYGTLRAASLLEESRSTPAQLDPPSKEVRAERGDREGPSLRNVEAERSRLRAENPG